MELICQCGHYQSRHDGYMNHCLSDDCLCKMFVSHKFDEIDKMAEGSTTLMTTDTADFLNKKNKEKKLMNENKRNEIDGAIMAEEIHGQSLLLIPTEPTPMFYTMNPDEEDLVQGLNLKNGDIVLLEDSIGKGNTFRNYEDDEDGKQYNDARILEGNRWCMVTELSESYGGRRDIKTFIGLYGDGTKRSRTFNDAFYWFVKKAI